MEISGRIPGWAKLQRTFRGSGLDDLGTDASLTVIVLRIPYDFFSLALCSKINKFAATRTFLCRD